MGGKGKDLLLSMGRFLRNVKEEEGEIETGKGSIMRERQTQIRKINYFDELLKDTSDLQTKNYLESFKVKLDFVGYYLDNYEDGIKKYNTPFSEHDIALVLKANAEAIIFSIKSLLDCLANFLYKRFDLKLDKVYFNRQLARKLGKDKTHKEKDIKQKVSEIIEQFLDDNDYFFELRNLMAHNTVVKVDYSVELPASKIKASFQNLPKIKNIPSNLEISAYSNNMIDKIYCLSESIFEEILGKKISHKE